MMRVLVVQLCRLGDILQTTPMLRGLRRIHPDAEISLMVLDGFAHTPVPGHLYDRLIAFPFDEIIADLRTAPPDWPSSVQRVRRLVADLGRQPFDRVLNLTGSPVANLLCAIVPSREVHGGLIAPDRTRVVRGPWMTYFWSSLLARSQGAINIVDLFRLTAGAPSDGRGLEIDVPADAAARIDTWLAGCLATDERLVAVQLGASDERKRWPAERVGSMIERLPADFGRIVFVGAEGERPLLDRATAHVQRPWLDALGATRVPELAALLRRCRLLITNDTGTMHVAAAVGTQILDLSTGPVFVHETGAYLEGAIAVEPVSACFPCAAGAVCHHLACREDFTPDDIAALACFAVGEGPLPRPARARVLRATRVRSGRLEYRPLWDPAPADAELLRQAFGEMWDRTLPSASPDVSASGTAIRGVLNGDVRATHVSSLASFVRLADRAASIASTIPGAGPAGLYEASVQLQESLERAVLLGQLGVAVQPIVGYLRTAIESCAEREVAKVAEVYGEEWAAAARRARLLADLLGGEDACLAATSAA
jgi:ADP-heptose:LPS heptosyltransferase